MNGWKRSGRGDRVPTPEERALCAFWREHELRLLRPRLIVMVGGLAVRELIGGRRLDDCVGERLLYHDAVAVVLPHPSGASGWLNSPANRLLVERAAALIREQLARLTG